MFCTWQGTSNPHQQPLTLNKKVDSEIDVVILVACVRYTQRVGQTVTRKMKLGLCLRNEIKQSGSIEDMRRCQPAQTYPTVFKKRKVKLKLNGPVCHPRDEKVLSSIIANFVVEIKNISVRQQDLQQIG